MQRWPCLQIGHLNPCVWCPGAGPVFLSSDHVSCSEALAQSALAVEQLGC